MKNYLLILGVISIFMISACSQQQPTEPSGQAPIQAETPVPGQEGVEEIVVVTDSGVKEFNMISKKWDFTPSTITVSEGDVVKLNIDNIDIAHGFALFEFGVNERLEPGKTTTVEFTADKAGEYKFFCSVPCGSGHSSMDGTLIVE
jgi:cytochrome c oxidase subunit 2|tara:strand:- start:3902 stop:4339 length:438 start_codon:yes stop_codon:yes gene_type:complete